MKKLLLVALIGLAGCSDGSDGSTEIENSNYRIYEVDSCEYIGFNLNSITHKGNCKYCAERKK